jgi:hypothetical protein
MFEVVAGVEAVLERLDHLAAGHAAAHAHL